MLKTKTLKKHTGLAFILMPLLCIISDDSMLFGTNKAAYTLVFRAIFYIITIFLLLYKCKWKVNSGSFIMFSVFFFAVVLTVIVNSHFTNGYIFFLLTLFLGLVVTSYYTLEEFALIYTKFLVNLSLASLFLMLIYLYIPSVIQLFPKLTNNADNEYYNMFISVFPLNTSSDVRNYSLFREPGVYSIYLCLALVFTLLYEPVSSIINKTQYSLILIISILTTLSTAGFLCLGIILILYSYKYRNIMVAITLLCLILFVIMYLGDSIFDKLNVDAYSYRSTMSRTSSVVIPAYIILENPITGVGLDYFSLTYEKISYSLFQDIYTASGSSTNTLMNSMAIFGVPIGVLILFSVFRFSRFISSNKTVFLGVGLILILLMSTQELRMSFLFSIIIMYSAKP